MKLNEQFKNIPVYQPGKSSEDVKKEFGIKEVIKLASNENPFGTSKAVKERIKKDLDYLAVYPDPAGSNLKEKLSSMYQIESDNIILGNGSDEIIHYLSRVYLNPDTEVLMATPTFPIYKANALMENAKIVEVPLTNGKHDLDQMAEKITEKTAIIWICNPNNPTGTIVSEEELIDFLEKVPSHPLVVIDEAYAEYVYDKQYPNIFKLMKSYPNLMLLRTFSKVYGLAGLRIGYGIANKEVINDLHKVKDPFNTNHIAQIAAEAALSDQEFVKYSREQNYHSKSFLFQELEKLGIEYYPSETNFVLVFHRLDDEYVVKSFLEAGIIIRPGNKLGIPGSLRVTIGTMEQMRRVVEVLRNLE